MEKLNLEKADKLPARRMNLEERQRYLVYQSNKDYILKMVEVGAITKEEVKEFIQGEFPFMEELPVNEITKADY